MGVGVDNKLSDKIFCMYVQTHMEVVSTALMCCQCELGVAGGYLRSRVKGGLGEMVRKAGHLPASELDLHGASLDSQFLPGFCHKSWL